MTPSHPDETIDKRLIKNFIDGVLARHRSVLGISVQILMDQEPPGAQTWVEIRPLAGRDMALQLFADALQAEKGQSARRRPPRTP